MHVRQCSLCIFINDLHQGRIDVGPEGKTDKTMFLSLPFLATTKIGKSWIFSMEAMVFL
jgi:hypothetical protein